MTIDEFKNFVWLEPWCATVPGFEKELAKEVGEKHPLFKITAISVGRRLDCDDILFFLPNGPSPLALVHLTWTGKKEISPEWPSTSFYSSLEEWKEKCMQRDHEDWSRNI